MPRKTDSRFWLLSILLALFALALVWGIGLLIISPPRSTLFWMTEEFLSFAIVVACLLGLNAAHRAKSQYRPSGATLAVVSTIFGLDVLVSLGSLFMFGLDQNPTPQHETYFAAWLIAVNSAAFILASFLYGFDISQRVKEAPALAARASYQGHGRRIGSAIERLAQVAPTRPAVQLPLDSLIRRLRTLQTELAHSTGGGLGSWESGAAATTPPDLEATVAQLTLAVDDFAASPEPQWIEKLAAIEKTLAPVQSAVDLLHSI